jgi:serine/threonine protein kinase
VNENNLKLFKKVDIYSFGLLLSSLIKEGSHPFYRFNEIKKDYLQNIIQFGSLIDEKFNKLTGDFIKRLLDYSPENRYNLNDIEEHPLINRNNRLIPLTSAELWKVYNNLPKFVEVKTKIHKIQKEGKKSLNFYS